MFLTICFKNNFENKSAIFFHPLGKGPVPVQLGKIASKKIKGEFSLIYANATYFAFIRVLKSKQQDFSTYCFLYQCPTFSHFHAFNLSKCMTLCCLNHRSRQITTFSTFDLSKSEIISQLVQCFI